MVRDYQRHPEPTAPDLGLLCLRAVTLDPRSNETVRRQAERLLEFASITHSPVMVAVGRCDGRERAAAPRPKGGCPLDP